MNLRKIVCMMLIIVTLVIGVVPTSFASESTSVSEAQLKQKSSAFEALLTRFVVKGLGDNIRGAVKLALGSSVTIDSLLFNEYSNTRLAIFDSAREIAGNDLLENTGLLDGNGSSGVMSTYFNFFRTIAFSFYVAVLLYIAVRILLQSTGSSKEKYKSMLVDWVKGIVILVFIPYIMNFLILINNGIVDYLKETKNSLPVSISLPALSEVEEDENLSEENANGGDLMIRMRSYALVTGRLVYGMLYLFLVKQLIGFVFIYFKRLISVIFLIVIFPLVMIAYAMGNSGVGKSNAFSNWFKEFNLNVFLQAFQATSYLIVMSVIFALTEAGGANNIVLVLVSLEFLSKADELLRGMFSKVGGKAGSVPKSLSEAVKTVATVKIAKDLIKKVGGVGKKITNFGTSVKAVTTSYNNYLDARYFEKEQRREREESEKANTPGTSEYTALHDIEGNFNTILNISGARNSEEVIEAIKNSLAAKYSTDPALRDAYKEFLDRLDPLEKEKIEKLSKAMEMIMAGLNGNVDLHGRKLTNAEINLNATLYMEIIESKGRGIYRDLYRYINPKASNPNARERQVIDAEGNVIGNIKDVLEKQAKERILDVDEARAFRKAQDIVGNATGINGARRVTDAREDFYRRRAVTGERAVSEGRAIDSSRLVSLNHDERSALQGNANRLMTKYSASGVRAEKASHLVATVQEYQRRIEEEKSIDGMTANESMSIATEMYELYEESIQAGDSGVVRMIESLQDEVGFSLDQFRATAAVNVVNNYQSLDGDAEEQQSTLNEAYVIINDVNNNSKDKVAKTIVYRSEVDEILNGTIKEGCRPIRMKQTVEEHRDKEYISELRRKLEKEYDKKTRKTSDEARAELLTNLGKTVVAGVDLAVVAPISAATSVTAAAMYGGLTGTDNPTDYLAAMDFGATIPESIASLVPGTASAKNKNSFGSKIDNGVKDVIKDKNGLTDSQKYGEINERIVRNQSARSRIESFDKHIRRER